MNNRKNLRISIPEDDAKDFDAAKRRAEDQLACKMTDSQYAASLVRWAIRLTRENRHD